MAEPGYPLNLYQSGDDVTPESLSQDDWPFWWKTNPPWEYDNNPTLEDLVRIMRPREREDWDQGGYSLQEREDILALLQKRWLSFRKSARLANNSAKGQVAHTRGWEPGDPLDTPPTKLLVDGVEQRPKTEPSKSPHLTDEDLARIDTFDDDEGFMAQASAAPPGSEPMSEEERNQLDWPRAGSLMDVPTPDKWLPTTTSDTGVQKEVREIRLSVEDNMLKPKDIELRLADALPAMGDAAFPPPESPKTEPPKPESPSKEITGHVKDTVDVAESKQVLEKERQQFLDVNAKPSEAAGRVVLAILCEVVGAWILNQIAAPLLLAIPLLVLGAIGFFQWHRVTRTSMRQIIFWIFLGSLVLATVVVVIVRKIPTAPEPATLRIGDTEVATATVKSWGTSGNNLDVYAVVNASEFLGLADRYQLVMICRAQDNAIDFMDDIRIDRSARYSIQQTDQTLQLTLSQDTGKRLVPEGWINFYVLLVPKKVDPGEFRSIREFIQNGSYIIAKPSIRVRPNFGEPPDSKANNRKGSEKSR